MYKDPIIQASLVVTLKNIKRPTHMVDGGHHLRKRLQPPPTLCEENPPAARGTTSEQWFPSQRTSNAESVSMQWHHFDGERLFHSEPHISYTHQQHVPGCECWTIGQGYCSAVWQLSVWMQWLTAVWQHVAREECKNLIWWAHTTATKHWCHDDG